MDSMKEYNYLVNDLEALYHEMALRAGLSDSEYHILYTLAQFGDECTQANISRLTGISRQTINSAIRKMVREGILVLSTDGKRRPLVLTDKGQRLMAGKVRPLLDAERAMLDSWPEEERRALLRLTGKYYTELKQKLYAIGEENQ